VEERERSSAERLYDFGVTDDGAFYYVMELLQGLSLDSLVKRFGPGRRSSGSVTVAGDANQAHKEPGNPGRRDASDHCLTPGAQRTTSPVPPLFEGIIVPLPRSW
jgi:hypothetical protein